tara:strand:- start:210 stop:590 length:381 start_codon:yes stop_codon:yes gene_type:complete
MPVHRISKEGLHKIINNKVNTKANCIVKFYSNGCHLCHGLHDYYIDISDQFEDKGDTFFYAFNIDDDPSIEKLLDFNGVPTIVLLKPDPKVKNSRCKVLKMEDPEKPNKKTWYRTHRIIRFIQRNT